MRSYALVLLALVSCNQPPDPGAEASELVERLDGIFAAYDSLDRPGYAIGILREGRWVVAKGYGGSDIEKEVAITRTTAFNLASLSKQFTGATVAMEIERGDLSLNDPLADHWPGLPEFMRDIAIGHLVYMTSGLPEYYNLPSPRGGWASEDRFTVEDAIDTVFAAGHLEYAPGARWSYSNINYQILAVMVARLHGRTFAEHLDIEVFGPLGMTTAWVDSPIDTSRPYRATSYEWDDGQGWRVAPRLSPHFGGSGVFASLEDLGKWDAALYRTDALGPTFRERMLSTRRYDHDKDNDAFGLVHGSYRGLDTIWYEGGDYGASTYMVRIPEHDETIICLANFSNAECGSKARLIIDTLLSLAKPGPP